MLNAAWFNHYEPNVPYTLAYPEVPLHQFLETSARRYPHHIATKFVLKYVLGGRATIGGTLTYRQLNEYADRFANALAALGVRKGDRVAIMLPNTPQFVIAFYGALKAGATVVNINPTYTAQELKHQLIDSGAQTVVVLNLFSKRLDQIKSDTAIKHTIVTHVFDLLPSPVKQLVRHTQQKEKDWIDIVPSTDMHLLEELLAKHAPQPPQVDVQPDDVA